MIKQIIFSLFIAISLAGCSDQNGAKVETSNPNAKQVETTESKTTEETANKPAEVKTEENTTETASGINKNSTLEDFKGKPSIIMIVGTYCGHCQKSVPIFEEQIWQKYNEQANLWLNVIDGKYFAVYDAAQGLNPNLSFQGLTGEECGYIPSWVMLDKDGNVVSSSCGNKKSIDEMEEELKKLL